MGRKSRDKQNRRVNNQKPADNESKTTAMDGKKVMNGSFDDKESINRSNEDIMAEEQTLRIANITEHWVSVVNQSRKRTFENFFIPEDQSLSRHITKELREFGNYLKSEHSDIFETISGYVIWFREVLYIRNYPYVKRLLDYVSRIEEFLILNTIEDDLEDRDEAKTLPIFKIINDNEEITSDLSRVDGKNTGNVDDCGDVQRHTQSMPKSTTEGKDEKYSKGICSNIQEKEGFPHIMELEFDDEALIKVIDTTDKNMEKEKDSSATKRTKENLNLSPTQKKYKKITFLEFHRDLRKQLRYLRSKSKFKETLIESRKLLGNIERIRNVYYLRNELNPKSDEKIKTIAKEKVDQKNDRELKIVEGHGKEKEFDSSIDCIQMSDQNTNEGKNKGQRYTEGSNRPNDDIQDFHSSKELPNLAQETEDYDRRDNEQKTMNTKQSKKLNKQARQTGKLEKEKYNYPDMNLGQIFRATGEATDNEDRRNYEVSTADEFDSSTDCIQMPDQNTNEGKNKGQRCTEGSNRPNDNIQDFHSRKELPNLAQETEDYDRRDNEQKTLNTKLSKKINKGRQTGKLEREKYNYPDMNLGQIFRDTGEATYNEDRRNGEVSTADEPVEVIKDLNKRDNIHFEFVSSNSKHIFTGNPYDYYSFSYKDKNVQFRFTGNQIFISTEDNEFNIFIRKSDSVNLTDKATQTSGSFSNIK